MNKQELIDKLKKQLATPSEIDETYFNKFYELAINYALYFAEQLDEPEKPVLTEEEAEWIEGLKDEQKRRPFWTKYSMLYFVTRAGFGYGFSYDNDLEDREVELEHYSHEIHVEKERLTNAILYGYEVEKEKLYTVELPNNGGYYHIVLVRNAIGEIKLVNTENVNWRESDYAQLTESEIKQDFDWAWQFAKEVEE